MAGYQGEDVAQLVKSAANITEVIGEHVALKRAGVNLKGLCPFHSEKTPSFVVNPQRNTYHCFGCGEGGDVIRFMMQFHRLSFAEALKDLARRYQVDLPEKPISPQELEKSRRREALHLANEEAAAFFHQQLLGDQSAVEARTYLQRRGISAETIEQFRLGFAPEAWSQLGEYLGRRRIDEELAREAGLSVAKEKGGSYDRFRNRIMFPIFGLTGRVVGFGGRVLDDGQPKYMNSPESLVFDKGRLLYGLYQNREQIRKARFCIVVEGNFDLLSLVEHGVANVVAPLGTALTAAHLRSLKGYTDEVVLFFDGDQAGLKAAMRSVPLFLSERIDARIALLPESHDPDSFVREVGKEGLLRHLEKALPLPEFVFERLVAQHGTGVSGKARIVEELRELAKSIGNQDLQRNIFASHFAGKLGLAPRQLLEAAMPLSAPDPIRTAAGRPTVDAHPTAEGAGLALPMKQRQLLEFLVLHQEYLPAFLEAGLENIVVNPLGIEVLQLLCQHGAAKGGPEDLLDEASGAARPFISRLLIEAPSYADELREELAEGMLAWLKTNDLKAKKRQLVAEIDDAYLTNQDWLGGLAQKKEIDVERCS